MPKILKTRSAKLGLDPGTPIHIGDNAGGNYRITVTRYNDRDYTGEKELKTVSDLSSFIENDSLVTWVNVEGVPELDVLQEIGSHFNIHSLVLEDIFNMDQRPKLEDYGNYIYIVMKMLYFHEEKQEIEVEQISVILGNNYVISFRERTEDIFKPIRERLSSPRSRIREMKSDYLAYSLLDLIVDHYFQVLERMGDMIDMLEELFIINPTQYTLNTFHKLKKEVLFLRKTVWPLREVISGLERRDSNLISESLGIYLRDVYDHITQIIDIMETFRDMLSEMLDIYMSGISNRINEVMKVLTIITTIFIPLSFVAGIYGMNFKHMPELEWSWGYPLTLLFMAAVAVAMVVYFIKKKWLEFKGIKLFKL